MEDRDIYRVFEQVKPTRSQEEAMLERLFSEERKRRPMKLMKKTIAVLAAAALLLTTCAFAVVTGLDQRLLNYLGISAQEEPLLSPMAVPLDIVVEDSGCTLEVKQVLADRYAALILMEFTAPEGTVLDGDVYSLCSYQDILNTPFPEILNSNEQNCGWNYGWTVLEDGNPADNQIALIYTLEATEGEPDLLGSTLRFTFDELTQGVPAQSSVILRGNWSCSFTLPEEDCGQVYSLHQPITVQGCDLTCTSLYVSPLSLVIGLIEGEALVSDVFDALADGWANNISLTTADGDIVGIKEGRSMSTLFEHYNTPQQQEGGRFCYRPEQILDPAEIASITIFGQTFPLDGLVPVES